MREHPRWNDFTRQVESSYVAAVPETLLKLGCNKGLIVGPESGEEPVVACIKGALAELDSTSSYIEPATQARDMAESARNFVGIGLEFARKDRGTEIFVVQPIPGGPGDRAGIRPADRILSIDGVDLRPLSTEEAIAAMRGEAGSVARIAVLRTGRSEPFLVSATREPIRVLSARVKTLSRGLVYARINQFTKHAAEQLSERLSKLHWTESEPPAGLVLDLRHNPGGLFDSLVDVASALAPADKPVVATRSRNQTELRRTGRSKYALPESVGSDYLAGGWPTRVPIVVLVNEHTAGAAEALAQFLRETRGARLLGQQTYGAPYIQRRLLIEGGAAIKLVTSVMESPRGLRWEKGLAPDSTLENQVGKQPEFGAENDNWVSQAADILLPPAWRSPASR